MLDYFPRTRGISTLSSNAVIIHLLKEMTELRSELRSIQPLTEAERRALGIDPLPQNGDKRRRAISSLRRGAVVTQQG